MTTARTKIIEKGNAKTSVFRGIVVSDCQDKTVVVSVETLKTHSKYRKKYKSTKHYQVHDPRNKHSVGEVIEFRECRPLSRHKHHQVLDSDEQ